MSEIIFFILLFLCFLFCIACTIIGPYISSYIGWIKYSNNCKEIFGKEDHFNDLSLIIKNDKYKSLSIFIIFNLLNIITLSIFIWIWIAGNNNIIYIIPFIGTFLVSYVLLYFVIRMLFKKFELIGMDSKKIAINNFKIYQNNLKNNLKISEFKLYKSDKIASRNQPFQFNQWRYKGKIKRLNNKKYNEEKYNMKLLTMYIRYLKTYAIFFKGIKDSSSNDYAVVINDHKYQSLEPLKEVLINNFFAYANEQN